MLHLIISDSALHEAVLEQLTLAKLDFIQAASDIARVNADTDATLIIDEAALDKKTLKELQSQDGNKRCILLLGTASEEAVEIISESFPKPLRLGHLLARLDFYLKTAPRLRGTPVTFGPYRLESQNRQLATIETNEIIRLTEKETALLSYLAQKTEPVTRDEILATIWGYDARIDTHTLETHIYQLRRKLDPDDKGLELLINEQGGYRLKS